MDLRLLEQLTNASIQKGYEPEHEIDWDHAVPESAPVLPDWALSIGGLPAIGKLPAEERNSLARSEVAAVCSMAIRFEQTLIRNLGKYVQHGDPEASELPYLLHVIEEEARHNRMFIRLIGKMGVGGYPARGVLGAVQSRLLALIRSSPCFFYLGVFGVEEITDSIFAEWMEDPDTDEVVRAVCRLHRIEEARHRRFSLEALKAAYTRAGRLHRFLTALVAPLIVNAIFDVLVPPSAYLRSGVAGSRRAAWQLWFRARQSPARIALRQRSAGPVIAAVRSLGATPSILQPLWAFLGTPVCDPAGL